MDNLLESATLPGFPRRLSNAKNSRDIRLSGLVTCKLLFKKMPRPRPGQGSNL